MNKELDYQNVLNLNVGQCASVTWYEEGGGVVYRYQDGCSLYEVPEYGGKEQLYKSYNLNQVQEMLDVAYSWN